MFDWSKSRFAAELRQTHGLLLSAAFAAAYLLNFYAHVYVEVNKTSPLIVFLNH